MNTEMYKSLNDGENTFKDSLYENRDVLPLNTAEPLILQPTIQEVNGALAKPKNNKAPGMNTILSYLLKYKWTSEQTLIQWYRKDGLNKSCCGPVLGVATELKNLNLLLL